MHTREIEKLKLKLASARREIQNLKMRLKNAEILYRHELEKAAVAKALNKKAQRN